MVETQDCLRPKNKWYSDEPLQNMGPNGETTLPCKLDSWYIMVHPPLFLDTPNNNMKSIRSPHFCF